MTTDQRVRDLRQRPTDAERRLWARLRNRQMVGAKFRRQHPIGPYIVDFVCFEKRLVIEVDGGQHAALTAREDTLRNRDLRRQRHRVLRVWNNDVLDNLDGVLARIDACLSDRS